MKLRFVLLAGVAAATLSGAMIAPAFADDDTYTGGGQLRHDDQADQTRALNRQALKAARAQDGSMMSEPDDANDADDSDAEERSDGRGGPEFQGPPGPNDYGDGDDQADDDQADDDTDMEPDMDDESTPD